MGNRYRQDNKLDIFREDLIIIPSRIINNKAAQDRPDVFEIGTHDGGHQAVDIFRGKMR